MSQSRALQPTVEELIIFSTFFPATVTVDTTIEVVLSATSTVTVTASATEYALKRRSHVRKANTQERAAAAAITPRTELPRNLVLKARQDASSSSRTLDVEALGSALSSACSCKRLAPLTIYLASTAPAVVSIYHSSNRYALLTRTDANHRSH